jgi:hypothetical protein
MENLTYWTTLAQVSATFTGLIFVGLVFYLEHINEAIKEVKQKLQVVETSSSLLNAIVLSSLILFLLPLATSFTFILEGEYPIYRPFFRFLLIVINTCALIVAIVLSLAPGLRLFSSTQNQHLPSIRRVNLRIWFGNVSILFVVLCMFVLIIPQFWFEQGWELSMMKLVSGISIGVGLFLSIFDLRLFDTNHIFFQVTDNVRAVIKVQEIQLQNICRHAGILLNNCCALLGDKKTQKVSMKRALQAGYPISVSELPGAIDREQRFWQDRFQTLRERIPDQGHLGCSAFLFQDIHVATLKELNELGEEMEFINEELDRFQKEISLYIQKLEYISTNSKTSIKELV